MAAKSTNEDASENLASGGEGASDERGIGDNSQVHRVVKKQLRSFIERIENVNEEIKAMQGDRTSIYAEAKGQGYDVKALRRIIRERAMDPADLAEANIIDDVYRTALGMVSMYRDAALAEQDGAAS